MLDILAMLAGLAGPAAAEELAAGVEEGLTVRYRCEAGAAVEVAYINTPEGGSYAVVLHAGVLVPMKAGPTGSGVRYVSLQPPALVWHTKGNGGFLANDDAGETMIAAGCVAG